MIALASFFSPSPDEPLPELGLQQSIVGCTAAGVDGEVFHYFHGAYVSINLFERRQRCIGKITGLHVSGQGRERELSLSISEACIFSESESVPREVPPLDVKARLVLFRCREVSEEHLILDHELREGRLILSWCSEDLEV